jgi:hypothetical protein
MRGSISIFALKEDETVLSQQVGFIESIFDFISCKQRGLRTYVSARAISL